MKGEVARDLYEAQDAAGRDRGGRPHGSGASTGSGRRCGGRRRRAGRRGPVPDAAPAVGARRFAAPPSLVDFVAPAETGLGDHVGAFAVAIHGARSSRAGSRRNRTTTARSWSVRSPTGSPRPTRSGCTKSRATSGTRRGGALGEELIRGAVPRNPPGVRLPRVPRPFGEGDAGPPARGRAQGRRPDRVVRDDPGAERERPLLRPSEAGTSRSGASDVTRSRTTPRGSECRSRTRSAGSARIWPMSRLTLDGSRLAAGDRRPCSCSVATGTAALQRPAEEPNAGRPARARSCC